MQTRCPACHTFYRIDDYVLQRAGGRARCFRCDTVFEAQPADDDTTEPLADLDQHTSDTAAPADDVLPEPDTFSMDLDELGALPEIPEADASGSESELDLSDLAEEHRQPDPVETDDEPLELGPDAESTDEGHAVTAGDPDEELPFEVPKDLPPLQPAEQPHPTAEESLEAPPPARQKPTPWRAVAAALLILLALTQLGWQQREQLLAIPAGYTLAEAICGMSGCQLPPRRAASRFVVLERHIGPAPEQAGALAMHLSFRNTAEFAQPLPDIQLSLYDSENRLMARRRLHPEEYLPPATPMDILVGSGEQLRVDLLLEDPGRKATGFKLEFL